MPIVTKETVNDVRFGWTSVGSSPAQVMSVDLPDRNMKGILIKAPGASDDTPNSEPVYIGLASVTADTAVATDGFPLAPGESITLPIETATTLYAVSASGGQLLAWIIV